MRGSDLNISLQQSYDRHAAERDGGTKTMWKLKERDLFLSYLQEYGSKTLLDIGAGPGHDSTFFRDHGLSPTSIDISLQMVRLCQAKGLTAYQMDLHNLDFPAKTFDAVWSLNCLLHVPNDELAGVLEGITSVLKPGGLFYFGVYGGRDSEGVWEEDSYHPKRFFSFHSDESLQRLVDRYFERLYFRPIDYGNPSLHFQSFVLRRSESAT